MSEGLLTYKDVAVQCSLCPEGSDASRVRAAQRFVTAHKIPVVRIGHRTVRIRPADLQRALARLSGEGRGL